MKVPFFSFSSQNKVIRAEAKQVFQSFFDSQNYVLGAMTQQFENEYAKYSCVKYAVGISNGIDALHLSLKALGIRPGDEVIIPSNTYIATVLAVEMTGAKPIFSEPSEETYNISPVEIQKKITGKTKAIIPVHLYGQACQMDEIMAIAIEFKLFVIEDNAQGHSSTFKGKITGSFGDINATSFYPTKNIGALGEAGAITTNDEKLASAVRALRNYGSERRYHNIVKGFNNRMDELQAGLLSLKLKHINQWTLQRQKIAERYIFNLKGAEQIILPFTHKEASHVYHLFVIRTEKRNELQSFLEKNGVETLIHYPIPPYLQQAYFNDGFKIGDFPIAEKLSQTMLSLPLFPGMSDKMVDYVSDLILKFYKN